MNLRIFETHEDLVQAAARALMQKVDEGARTIALSGGSTPKPLYELLGKAPLRDELVKHAITWVLVDERYVPRSDPQSNTAMIERTLFANGVPEQHRFLTFDSAHTDPTDAVATFEAEWHQLGLEDLDIVLLGCGDDGHTASLFPGTAALEVNEGAATAVFVPRLAQWRVTLTLPKIRAAKLRIVLATGATKAPIINDLRSGVPHPIGLATEGVETWWLVDRAAAGMT